MGSQTVYFLMGSLYLAIAIKTDITGFASFRENLL